MQKHSGDCFWFSAGVCTCGFLHHWWPKRASGHCPQEVNEQLEQHQANLIALTQASSARGIFLNRFHNDRQWNCKECKKTASRVLSEFGKKLYEIFGEKLNED